MRPIWHFIASSVIVLVMFPLYSYWALLAYLSGFLIDVDHYIYWIFKFKNFNLMENYRCHTRKNRPPMKNILHIFHLFEFWMLTWIVAMLFYENYGFVIFPLVLGMTIHFIMDFLGEIITKPIQKRVVSLAEFAGNGALGNLRKSGGLKPAYGALGNLRKSGGLKPAYGAFRKISAKNTKDG